MNSMMIGAQGVNRLETFLASQQASAGLREVNPAGLEAVEGGNTPVLIYLGPPVPGFFPS